MHSSLAFVALGILAQPADTSPTPEQVREAVKRTIVHIEKDGMAWMKNRKCSSCHQVPMTAWTLNAARKRGFAVDETKVDAVNEWIVNDALVRNNFYKLTDASFGKIKQGGLDPAKLQPMKEKTFVVHYEFHGEVTKALTPEAAAQHKDLLRTAAAVPGQGGQGGSASASGYTAMLNATALYGVSDKARLDLVNALVKAQQADGTWKPGGQFFALQWPGAEAQQALTMWAVLALSSVGELPEPAVTARNKALAALKNGKPGVSTETLVLQMLIAHKQGETERAQTLLEQLFKQQHADGGWGWVQAKEQSDAYATGLVLYGLGTMGRKNTDPHVQQAWKYLLSTQRPEGDWFVHRKAISGSVKKSDDEGNYIFSFWGTGWSMLGLMATLPD